MDSQAESVNAKLIEAEQRAEAYADFSPDGGMPEDWHHVDRRGMGGRPTSMGTLRTMGVSAVLHNLIHTQGDHVLEQFSARPTLSQLW